MPAEYCEILGATSELAAVGYRTARRVGTGVRLLSLGSVGRDALRTQLWPMPVFGVSAAVAAGVALPRLDARLEDELPTWLTTYLFDGGAEAARGLLQAIAGSLITVTSLTFSLTVVTLQLASSQWVPPGPGPPRVRVATVVGMKLLAARPESTRLRIRRRLPGQGRGGVPAGGAAARTEAATRVYGTGTIAVRALDEVTVRFERGQFTAIMGPSGSGKSTLLHCAAPLRRRARAGGLRRSRHRRQERPRR